MQINWIPNCLIIIPVLLLVKYKPVLASEDVDRSCTLHSRTGVPVQGVLNLTVRGDSVPFCSFYRIPYARPPVKKYRFQKAQLVRLFNAKSKPLTYKTLPPECTQEASNRGGGLVGQEDCLFVNVFTRRGVQSGMNSSPLMPVVVWIHGGTFALGSGLSDQFNPSAFIEEDIVVVSFNYRLDLFGFFPVAPDEPYSMNLGLDDQKVALKWIRKHIKIFGGDPNRVTIMGWSAGSASVNYLLYNREAKGLFQSAIAMSGSFLSPWAFSTYPLRRRQLICDSYQVKECTLNGILKELGSNFNDLAMLDQMYSRAITAIVWGTVFPLFSPAPEYPGDSPELRMRMGPLNDVPLLVGVTNDEAKTFDLGHQIYWRQQSTFVFPNDDPKIHAAVVEMLRSVESQSKRAFKDHLAMADLYYGVYKFVELHVNRSEKGTFFYRFNYNPVDGTSIGASHGDDIKLLFRAYEKDVPANRAMAKSMQKLWSNFIKFK